MNDSAHSNLRDVPIGIEASGQRHETDSMGGIDVPADRYWGAQTQRSLVHFAIGGDRMPKDVYHAYGYVKKAAALVNAAAGRLPKWKADAIARIAELVGRSLMPVTALSPVIGYDKASAIAHQALAHGATLKAEALETGWIDERTFDEVVDPRKMAHPI